MRCSIAFPIFIILLGSLLLIENVFPEFHWLREARLFWPLILIFWGVAMLGRRSGWRNF
jgi:surface polysaccharide O-acyltransferase-like enzyme